MGTSQNSSHLPPCGIMSFKSRIIFTAWSCVYFLFLPIFVFVLYVGFTKWRRQRSTISHSDVFTFHMIAMELVCVAGCFFGFYGFYTENEAVSLASERMVIMTELGQMCFHCLTCVERYLAVVHPIAYLRLKKRGGVTARNVSVACTWLLCLAQVCVLGLLRDDLLHVVVGSVIAVLPFVLVSFCSVSVLCVLIRPGPGEKGGGKRSVDQSKRVAFCTMMAILAALTLRLVVMVVYHSVFLHYWYGIDDCVLSMSSNWFRLPSSLVLPLLFLHRARKLNCLSKQG